MQQAAFDLSLIPIARGSDPESSHLAAEEVTRKGIRAAQADAVLRAVIARPGHTSAELAAHNGWDRFMPARRLPELEHVCKVRRGAELRLCTATGRKCVAWWSA